MNRKWAKLYAVMCCKALARPASCGIFGILEMEMTGLTAALAVDLDRKLSRAMTRGKGMKLSAAQLDLLVSLGLLEALADAKAQILKEQARCRQIRVESINGEGFGSTLFEAQTASQQATDSIFGGTTATEGASSARARARRMFD
jgi:hypothetical protein